ncbi:MAG: hypothetical protein ABR955_06135 [Verrucomicrobiota bacterium]
MKTSLHVISLFVVVVLCGCQKPNKNGEVFVVLNSGDVIYMADMQILCFNSAFKRQFYSWQESYWHDSQNLTSEVETNDPTLQSTLTEIDNNIAALKLKAANVLQDTKTTTSDLLLKLQYERDALVAEETNSSKASDEYIQITQPINQKINELEAEADKISSDQAALMSDTLTKINQYIVQAQLTVPKLDGDATNDLFDVETGSDGRNKIRLLAIQACAESRLCENPAAFRLR